MNNQTQTNFSFSGLHNTWGKVGKTLGRAGHASLMGFKKAMIKQLESEPEVGKQIVKMENYISMSGIPTLLTNALKSHSASEVLKDINNAPSEIQTYFEKYLGKEYASSGNLTSREGLADFKQSINNLERNPNFKDLLENGNVKLSLDDLKKHVTASEHALKLSDKTHFYRRRSFIRNTTKFLKQNEGLEALGTMIDYAYRVQRVYKSTKRMMKSVTKASRKIATKIWNKHQAKVARKAAQEAARNAAMTHAGAVATNASATAIGTSTTVAATTTTTATVAAGAGGAGGAAAAAAGASGPPGWMVAGIAILIIVVVLVLVIVFSLLAQYLGWLFWSDDTPLPEATTKETTYATETQYFRNIYDSIKERDELWLKSFSDSYILDEQKNIYKLKDVNGGEDIEGFWDLETEENSKIEKWNGSQVEFKDNLGEVIISGNSSEIEVSKYNTKDLCVLTHYFFLGEFISHSRTVDQYYDSIWADTHETELSTSKIYACESRNCKQIEITYLCTSDNFYEKIYNSDLVTYDYPLYEQTLDGCSMYFHDNLGECDNIRYEQTIDENGHEYYTPYCAGHKYCPGHTQVFSYCIGHVDLIAKGTVYFIQEKDYDEDKSYKSIFEIDSFAEKYTGHYTIYSGEPFTFGGWAQLSSVELPLLWLEDDWSESIYIEDDRTTVLDVLPNTKMNTATSYQKFEYEFTCLKKYNALQPPIAITSKAKK